MEHAGLMGGFLSLRGRFTAYTVLVLLYFVRMLVGVEDREMCRLVDEMR
jgi:hypothetical protein